MQCACSGLVIISCGIVLSCFVNVSSVFALKSVWSLSTVAVIMFYCCSKAGNGQHCVVRDLTASWCATVYVSDILTLCSIQCMLTLCAER